MSNNTTSSGAQFYLLLIISTLALILSAFSVYKLAEAEQTTDTAEAPSMVDQMFNQYGEVLDSRIDQRIDQYVERRRVAAAKAKFAKYEAAPERPVLSGNKVYGNENARFTLIEYSDFECPFCKRYFQTPKDLVDASEGQLNLTWKHLPLPFHNPIAMVEAQASECVRELAGNRAFWVFAQDLFSATKGNGEGPADLMSVATNLGVNANEFNSCMKEGRHMDTIQADLADAKSRGFNSTPITLIVDNETGMSVSVRGAQDPNAVASAVARLRKQADLASR